MPRYEIRLSEKMNQVLTDLATTEKEPRSEIVRLALALYHFCRIEHRGSTVVVTDPNGDETEVTIK